MSCVQSNVEKETKQLPAEQRQKKQARVFEPAAMKRILSGDVQAVPGDNKVASLVRVYVAFALQVSHAVLLTDHDACAASKLTGSITISGPTVAGMP